jgi:hypothetical protein
LFGFAAFPDYNYVVAKKGIRELFQDYIVEVAAGLTLILITGRTLLQVFFPEVLQSIWQGVTTAGGFLLSPVSLPVWLLGVLSLLSLFTLIVLFLRFVPKKVDTIEEGPSLSEYTEDYIFGLIWRWRGVSPNNLPVGKFQTYCPDCYTRLIPSFSVPKALDTLYPAIQFFCQTCNKTIAILEGNVDDISDKVGIEIERKINTGEWKDVVMQSKAGRLVPKVRQ